MCRVDKCLECTSFCGILLHFRENYEIYVIRYTHFSFLRLGVIFFVFYGFWTYLSLLWPQLSAFLTPHECLQVTMPAEEKEELKNTETEPTMTPP